MEGGDGTQFLNTPTSDEDESVVLHVDMDCFYAACERLREPKLRGEPVVIGMGYDQEDVSGAVATASYEAREHGIESAQPISKALDNLPRRVDVDDGDDAPAGYYRPVDMGYYESVSDSVMEILQEAADTLRRVSIDEAYLDVSDTTSWQDIETFASSLKAEISEDVGVTASIGVAPNMSAAKIASDHDKPDGLVIVEPGEVEGFLEPLPVEDVHGVGPVTARELDKLGIETAGDLTDADPTILEEKFGERGREFHERAQGIDRREVTPRGKPKSVSNESSLGPTTTISEQQERIKALVDDVAERAQAKSALYRTIGIKVVETPYDVSTRERSLSGPVDNPELLEEIALDLFDEFAGAEVRKLGVRVSNLSFSDRKQAVLDDWDGDGIAVGDDCIRERHLSAGGVQQDPQRSLTDFTD